MTDVDIALPSDWSEHVDETQRGSALVEFQHETDDGTTFIVSVLPRTTADEGYTLRLSTITQTPTHVRHDYTIDEYDSLEDAVDGTESFLEQLSHRLRDGSISSTDPAIDEIRNIIRAFTGERRFRAARRLIRRSRCFDLESRPFAPVSGRIFDR